MTRSPKSPANGRAPRSTPYPKRSSTVTKGSSTHNRFKHLSSESNLPPFATLESSPKDTDQHVSEDNEEDGSGDHVKTRVERTPKPASTPRRVPLLLSNSNLLNRRPLYKGQTRETIVRHADLHPMHENKTPRGPKSSLRSSNGDVLLEKQRWFLIVGHTDQYSLECPMYTYNEKGLGGRSKETWREYCSLKPPFAHNFRNQSPENEVLDIVWVKQDTKPKDTSVVHLSDVRFRERDAAVKVLGFMSRPAHTKAAKVLRKLLDEALEQ